MNIYQIAYYLGYRKEDKIYPLGPFNEKGKLKPILLRSYDTLHSFDCEKVEVTDSEFSEELYKEFECDGDKRKNKRYHVPLKKIMLKDLPEGSFISRGFFPVNEVNDYEKSDGTKRCFYDFKTPSVYAELLKNEIQLGKKTHEYDEYEQVNYHYATDYMYYAYPDYSSKYYEAFLIKMFADVLRFNEDILEKDIVILEQETKSNTIIDTVAEYAPYNI